MANGKEGGSGLGRITLHMQTTHDLAILRLDGITCSRLLAGHFKNLCSPSDGAIPAG